MFFLHDIPKMLGEDCCFGTDTYLRTVHEGKPWHASFQTVCLPTSFTWLSNVVEFIDSPKVHVDLTALNYCGYG